MSESLKTAKSQIRRVPSRGIYNRDEVYQILDQTFLCHVSFNLGGKPFMIPTSYGRKDDTIYLHGSVKSQMITALAKEMDLCFCVTFLDGLVLARSAFHHSINYRSVILYGKAERVEDEIEKNEGLKIITDQIIPGRWEEARQPTEAELKATAVLKFKIEEGAAKIRAAGPSDDQADYGLPIWAGLVPLQQQVTSVIPDPLMTQDLEIPASVVNYLKDFDAKF
ncbi:MAG: pyridoxamine 5'-phosphate oxidase family protein [Flammeovirgaceae bacterium]